MAKDVDLSSKEWRDLVFEGKNKEFGAYTLRADSTRRHTYAIVVVLGVLTVILVFLILWLTGVFKMADEETNVKVQQEAVETSSEEEETKEDAFIPEEDLLGIMHYNAEVIDADRQGKSPYDFSQTAVEEIRAIKAKIDSL